MCGGVRVPATEGKGGTIYWVAITQKHTISYKIVSEYSTHDHLSPLAKKLQEGHLRGSVG